MNKAKASLAHPNRFPIRHVERVTLELAGRLRNRWRAYLREAALTLEHGRPELRKALGPRQLQLPLTPQELRLLDDLAVELLLGPGETFLQEAISHGFTTGVLLARDPLKPSGEYKPPPVGAVSTARQESLVDQVAFQFAQSHALNAVRTKDEAQLGSFRGMLLEALQNGRPPREAAKRASDQLKGDMASWTRIARTEMASSLNAGLFAEAERLGADYVYVPRQPSACESCHRLVIERVFPRDALSSGSNRGRKHRDWVACVPLHPNCTCTAIPASSWLVETAKESGRIGPEGVRVEYVPPAKR